MRKANVLMDRDFAIGHTDPRLFGAFVEHLGRCVYGGIYEPGHPTADKKGFRGDVLALVGVPMRAMFHNAAFIAEGVPVFDIREKFGATDMLVGNGEKGVALAQAMGTKDLVLMRAQGSVACGPTLPKAVFRMRRTPR